MIFWKTPEYRIYETPTFKETVTTVTYTPQFKELSDAEITEVYDNCKSNNCIEFARAILTKAQEK